MEMKWHPIENGDLSGIPRDKRFLFTGIDDNELYVDFGYIDSWLEKPVLIDIGDDFEIQVGAKELIAWMELPEPFEQGRCDICKHWRVFIDGSGNRWSKCELLGFATFVPLKKCPLKK